MSVTQGIACKFLPDPPQLSLAIRVTNLYFEYGRNHAHPATDLLIGRRESDELDAYVTQFEHLRQSNMTRNDDQHFMGLRFIRTSALSQLVVGCFLVEK